MGNQTTMIGTADYVLLLQAAFGLSPTQAVDVIGKMDRAWRAKHTSGSGWEETVELLLRSVYESLHPVAD